VHPDRDYYYPRELQNLWGAPNWEAWNFQICDCHVLLLLLRSFKQKLDPFQFWLWFKRDETPPNSSIKQSTRQRKAINAKPQGEEKGTKREDPSRSQKRRRWLRLVLKDVLLARRIYPSSLLTSWRYARLVFKDVLNLPGEFSPRLLRWRYALCALFICSLSHSHHHHYACTLPLSKYVSTSVVGFFDFEKNLQFWFLFGVSQKTEPPLQLKHNLCF